jgi:hypothetical protein
LFILEGAPERPVTPPVEPVTETYITYINAGGTIIEIDNKRVDIEAGSDAAAILAGNSWLQGAGIDFSVNNDGEMYRISNIVLEAEKTYTAANLNTLVNQTNAAFNGLTITGQGTGAKMTEIDTSGAGVTVKAQNITLENMVLTADSSLTVDGAVTTSFTAKNVTVGDVVLNGGGTSSVNLQNVTMDDLTIGAAVKVNLTKNTEVTGTLQLPAGNVKVVIAGDNTAEVGAFDFNGNTNAGTVVSGISNVAYPAAATVTGVVDGAEYGNYFLPNTIKVSAAPEGVTQVIKLNGTEIDLTTYAVVAAGEYTLVVTNTEDATGLTTTTTVDFEIVQAAAPSVTLAKGSEAGKVKLVGSTTAMKYQVGSGEWKSVGSADLELELNADDIIRIKVAEVAQDASATPKVAGTPESKVTTLVVTADVIAD